MNYEFPVGTRIERTFENDEGDRTIIVVMCDDSRRRWVRCGGTGTWLVREQIELCGRNEASGELVEVQAAGTAALDLNDHLATASQTTSPN